MRNKWKKEGTDKRIVEGVRMDGNQGRRKEYKWMMSGRKEQINKWKEGKNDWRKEGGGMNDGNKEEKNRWMN